jgi:hypothetical protein
MKDHDYMESIKRDGIRAKGKVELLKYLEGGRLTFKQAIHGKCYDCMGFFQDGRIDCELLRCPLYPFMVFNPKKKKGSSRMPADGNPS